MASASRPTPTVKTGTDAAFIASSASDSEASVVSAPSLTTHQPGQRQPGQLLARAVERGADARLRAGERQVGSLADARGDVDEKPERAQHEAIGERLQQRRVGRGELLPRERPARLAFQIGDLHDPRIVDQDAQEVLLRHRRLDDQHRPEQAEEHEREDGRPHRRQDERWRASAFDRAAR